jgi:hypothetical protein
MFIFGVTVVLYFIKILSTKSGMPELGGGAGGAAAPVALYQGGGQGGQRGSFNLKDCLCEIANCQKC